MGRRPRVNSPGTFHHAMARGVRGQSIFLEDRDFHTFLLIMEEAKRRHGFELYAYCLMPNHFHILLRTGRSPLSAVIQGVLTQYSKFFNRNRGEHGHLFQGRFKSIVCGTDSYFLELLRYIHLNPVVDGLARVPEDWRWSGHHALIADGPARLIDRELPLGMFAPDTGQARTLYQRFLEEKPNVEEINRALWGRRSDADMAGRAQARQELADLAAAVERETRVSLLLMRSAARSQLVARARVLFAARAVARGFTAAQISAFLGKSPAVVRFWNERFASGVPGDYSRQGPPGRNYILSGRSDT